MRDRYAEKKLKYELIKRYGLIDMLTGQPCYRPTLHHIDHNHSNNSFENGSLISEKTQHIVHKYPITDFRYWGYATQLKMYKEGRS